MASAESDDPSDFAEINGLVTRVEPYRPGEHSTFNVQSALNGKQYRVACSFFCPLQVNDAVFLLVKIESDGHLTVIRQPFVQIPIDKNSICQCFIRVLHGSGFSKQSALTLYDRLKTLANIGRRYPIQSSQSSSASTSSVEAKSAESNISEMKNIQLPSATNSSPSSSSSVSESLPEFKGDGVIQYLNELSLEYYQSRNKKILEVCVKNTHLKEEQIIKLLIWWYQNRSLRRLYLLGINKTEIEACKMPHDEIYKCCMDNPYKLPPLSMKKCADILASMNREPTISEQECGEIVRKVYAHCKNGWTATPMWIINKEFKSFRSNVNQLKNEYNVIVDMDCAYLPYPYKVETFIAKYFNQLILDTASDAKKRVARPPIETPLYKCETLTDEQKVAIQGALINRVSIITGGAGTGKTTIIGEITRANRVCDIPYVVCAFTGKAVARLKEVLDEDSATMDRLIARFGNEVKFKHAIFDEASMITTELMYRFLTAFPGEYKMTLVGDLNQLPPIGWGSLMRELVASGRIPTFTLSENQRIIPHALDNVDRPVVGTEAPSKRRFERAILDNANALISPARDLSIPLEFKEGKGFIHHEGNVNTVTEVVQHLYDANVDPDRITIICPYKEPLRELNSVCQRIYLHSAEKHVDSKGRTWCVGDRVMMLGNNYGINVMNGEEGLITAVDVKGVTVKFKDGANNLFKYSSSDPYKKADQPESDHYNDDELTVQQITQSFAITVHKSQGSEYEFVILYLPRRGSGENISRFVNYNLLYTAMTRTKRALFLVADNDVLGRATMTCLPRRVENLSKRLVAMKNVELEQNLNSVVPMPPEPAAHGDEIPSEVSMDDYALLYA